MAKEPGEPLRDGAGAGRRPGAVLDDRPILGRRPTVVERAAKWTRRHRQIVVTAATVLVLALACGAAAVGVQVCGLLVVRLGRLGDFHRRRRQRRRLRKAGARSPYASGAAVARKILNVASAGKDKLAQNAQLADLIQALGCGTGTHYHEKDLRYEKVIIMTDGGTNTLDPNRLPNNFNWGPDNRIHAASGGIGGQVSGESNNGARVS